MDAKFCPRCGETLSARSHEGRERLACGACSFVFYDNPTPVVAAIVEHEGEIVLARQPQWPPSWYGLVTGFLERGETPEDGILRELDEELGLRGEIQSLVGVYAFEQRNEVIIAYHVRAEGEVQLSEEIEAIKRVALDKLRPWPFGTGHAVRDFLSSR